MLERRGVRRLAGFGPQASCVGTGVLQTSLAAVYDLVTDTPAPGGGLHAALATGALLAGAATSALEDGDGGVAGIEQSGGEPPRPSPETEEDGPVSSAGPSLTDPFGTGDSALDDPRVLLFLAIVLACMVSAAHEIRRALR